MDDQVLNVILIVLGALISIIGFLLTFYFKRGVDSIDKLNETVGELRVALSGLKAQFIANEDMDALSKDACKERHGTIDQTIKKHGITLEEHGKSITNLEKKVGI